MKVGTTKEIKHFSGYGEVTASVASITKYHELFERERTVQVVISVSGNHEQGLVPYCQRDRQNYYAASYCDRSDMRELFNFFMKPFTRKINPDLLSSVSYSEYDVKGVDNCLYTFIYKEAI